MEYVNKRREEGKKELPPLPEKWEAADLESRVKLAEELDKEQMEEMKNKIENLETEMKSAEKLNNKHAKEKEIRIKELEDKVENLERKLHQTKKLNISKIIDRQNKRHKEEAENRLKTKEKEQKEREERQQEFEKRQNMKSASFCTFCELFQSFRGHYCHLFKRYIRIDTANLVLLEGRNLEEVEAIPKRGQTQGTAVITSYATKTKMYQK